LQSLGSGERSLVGEHSANKSARGFSRALRRVVRPFRVLGQNPYLGWKSGVVLVAGLTILGAGLISVSGSAEDGNFSPVFAALGFAPAKLVLNGSNAVDEASVEGALSQQMKGSLFAFDATRARQTLLENPWLASVEVSKVYPETIVVDVVERQPFAFWKSLEQVRVIARDGVVLGDASPEHMRLPQVVGSGANVAASEFIANISKFPNLSKRAKAFVRVGGRRWNLVLRNDMKVLLPADGWKKALVELDRLQAGERLLEREVLQIDMRLPDRLVLRLDENLAGERREQLQKLLKRDWHRT